MIFGISNSKWNKNSHPDIYLGSIRRWYELFWWSKIEVSGFRQVREDFIRRSSRSSLTGKQKWRIVNQISGMHRQVWANICSLFNAKSKRCYNYDWKVNSCMMYFSVVCFQLRMKGLFQDYVESGCSEHVAACRAKIHSLAVTSAKQLLYLMVSSERVAHDLRTAERLSMFPLKIVCRQFSPIQCEKEFRLFVHNGSLNAISQYYQNVNSICEFF